MDQGHLAGRRGQSAGHSEVAVHFGKVGKDFGLVVTLDFAQSLPAALIARASRGLLNGNIRVLQMTVAEVIKDDKHLGVAYALMPYGDATTTAAGQRLDKSHIQPRRLLRRSFAGNDTLG